MELGQEAADQSGPIYGAIEAGGTKFVCALGREPGRWLERQRVMTEEPERTLAQVVEFFQTAQRRHGQMAGLGLASFGPIGTRGPEAGVFLETPKPGWSGFALGPRLGEALGLRVVVASDVQGAALAEGRWGAARGLSDFIYLTVGTGIGGGAVVGGRLLGETLHPEMGHLRVGRQPADEFTGTCPFHGDCWEGLACGPALQRRWGGSGAAWAENPAAVELEARYLAAGCWNLATVLVPQRIVLGGGVLQAPGLLARVQVEYDVLCGGYLRPGVLARGSELLVSAGIEDEAGLWGAWLLAKDCRV